MTCENGRTCGGFEELHCLLLKRCSALTRGLHCLQLLLLFVGKPNKVRVEQLIKCVFRGNVRGHRGLCCLTASSHLGIAQKLMK